MNNIIFIVGVIITLVMGTTVLVQMRHHPKGLMVCFFAETWERFSYYGMRALLIYYLTRHFLFSDAQASAHYGSYTTMVYLMPLIGGLIADRWLGTRKAIIFGGILLVIGHFGMAFEGSPTQQKLTYQGQAYELVTDGTYNSQARLKLGDKTYEIAPSESGGMAFVDLPKDAPLPAAIAKDSYSLERVNKTPWAENVFFLAISFIIMGVGFLKPNVSALVGQLYPDKDPRRDSGFQLYYFGINLGSFWASFFCGLLGESYGWGYGFGLAGIGMLAGLIWFVLGQKHLQGKGNPADPERLKKPFFAGINLENSIYMFGLFCVVIAYFLVQKNQIVGMALGAGAVVILGYVAFNMITKFNKIENFRLGLALTLTVASVIFWTLFEQAGSSLSTFADRNTNLNYLANPIVFDAFGQAVVLASKSQLSALTLTGPHVWIDMGINASQTQTFNPGFILIFAPIFAWIFTTLGKKGIDPDPVKKFAFGLFCAGLGFMVLVWSTPFMNVGFQVPVLFLMATYLFHTWGELALSPVGLSQQTKLSPPILVSTMMAIWFLGTSGAQYLAGFVAQFTATETVGGQVLDPKLALETSLSTFKLIGLWGIGLGAFFFVLSFFISKWAYGASDTDVNVIEPSESK